MLFSHKREWFMLPCGWNLKTLCKVKESRYKMYYFGGVAKGFRNEILWMMVQFWLYWKQSSEHSEWVSLRALAVYLIKDIIKTKTRYAVIGGSQSDVLTSTVAASALWLMRVGTPDEKAKLSGLERSLKFQMRTLHWGCLGHWNVPPCVNIWPHLWASWCVGLQVCPCMFHVYCRVSGETIWLYGCIPHVCVM